MRRLHKVMSRTLIALAVVATATSAAQAAKTTVDVKRDGRTSVTAPHTRVAVTPKRTKVRVEAPYTSVRVDTAVNQVRIRVPYFNGDISW